jgi:CheY-like chemotaxis protein
MPVIDGYKCTHLLRYHHPYKTYVQDVPIVAMTASAIQGDREKCKKAGMDDYLAKPVRSKVLEKMLLRWARQRPIQNTAPSSQTQGSEDSECSNAGEHCDNADIPGVEHDDNDFMDLRQGRPIITDSPQFLQPPAQAQPTITMTKPPLTRSITEETEVVRRTLERSDSALSAQTTKQVMRTNSSQTVKRTTWQETDGELAAQSRDDKLFDAAGARTGTGQGHLSHQLPHSLEPSEAWGGGEALTEANMVMHDKEEADKLAPP